MHQNIDIDAISGRLKQQNIGDDAATALQLLPAAIFAAYDEERKLLRDVSVVEDQTVCGTVCRRC